MAHIEISGMYCDLGSSSSIRCAEDCCVRLEPYEPYCDAALDDAFCDVGWR